MIALYNVSLFYLWPEYYLHILCFKSRTFGYLQNDQNATQ